MNILKDSKTKVNLMKAFAGESQARNRYTFGASQAKGEKLALIEQAFLYTADQERAHAKVFYNHLKESLHEKTRYSSWHFTPIAFRFNRLRCNWRQIHKYVLHIWNHCLFGIIVTCWLLCSNI